MFGKGADGGAVILDKKGALVEALHIKCTVLLVPFSCCLIQTFF